MQKQILITEDDIDQATILKMILEQNGYKVQVALDGAEAFDIIQKETVDLILMDLKMNWIEGDIVIRLVKTYGKTKQIPIIIITGLSPSEVAGYQTEGVEAVLFKPVETKLLLEKMKELLLKSD